jgi:hypothetical protein
VNRQGLQDRDLRQGEAALASQGGDHGLRLLPNLLPLTKDLRDNRLGVLDFEQGLINWMNRDGQSLAIRTEIKVLARGVHAFVANSMDSLAAARSVAHSAVLGHVSARMAEDDVIEAVNFDEAVVRMLLISDSLASFADVEIGTFDAFETGTIDPTAAHIAPRVMSHTGRGRSRGDRGRLGGCVPHRALVNDDSAWFMQCEELVVGIVGGVIDFAPVAEVEVATIEALVTNTDDRSLIATIAGDVMVDDWARLARTRVVTEWIHRDDGAPRGDGPGDEFKCVIKSSTMNCVC